MGLGGLCWLSELRCRSCRRAKHHPGGVLSRLPRCIQDGRYIGEDRQRSRCLPSSQYDCFEPGTQHPTCHLQWRPHFVSGPPQHPRLEPGGHTGSQRRACADRRFEGKHRGGVFSSLPEGPLAGGEAEMDSPTYENSTTALQQGWVTPQNLELQTKAVALTIIRMGEGWVTAMVLLGFFVGRVALGLRQKMLPDVLPSARI